MVHGKTLFRCGHLRFQCPCPGGHEGTLTLGHDCLSCGGPADVVREPPPWALADWKGPVPAFGKRPPKTEKDDKAT
jgi:hypothetical protein